MRAAKQDAALPDRIEARLRYRGGDGEDSGNTDQGRGKRAGGMTVHAIRLTLGRVAIEFLGGTHVLAARFMAISFRLFSLRAQNTARLHPRKPCRPARLTPGATKGGGRRFSADRSGHRAAAGIVGWKIR